MPLHSTGIGKAILAYLSEERLELVLAGGLEQRTPGTIVTPEELRLELERIRLRGYSTDMEENEVGVRCVGAPIFDHSLRVVGGISIAGPVFRFTQQRVAELGLQVVGTAQEISRRLGCAISPNAMGNQMRS
jgi:DNA-binding IclR family transcriptional regulator